MYVTFRSDNINNVFICSFSGVTNNSLKGKKK
jgi:hypothetical protein